MSDADLAPTPSRSRRLARDAAFQALYSVEVGRTDPNDAILDAINRQTFAEDTAEFVRQIVTGVTEHSRDLDATFDTYLAKGWELDRLAISDLLVLRIAVWELFHRPEMPPKVTISQAVDLGKRYGSKDSGAFINGVLGSLLPHSPKANWVAPIVDEHVADAESEPDLKADEEPELDEARIGGWVLRKED